MVRKVVILLFIPMLIGADYYVKNAGDDGAAGTSDGTAWKTISKVNGESFSAGDNIYFNRGDVWAERLSVPSSGSSGNHITIGAYGTGVKPRITGTASDDSAITLSNDNYVTVTDIQFEIIKDADGTVPIFVASCTADVYFDDIKCISTSDKDNDCILISNCSGFRIINSDIEGGNYGIRISESSGGYSGLIQNNIIHDQDRGDREEWDGIKCTGGGDFTGLRIADNVFYNWQEDGIDANGCGGEIIIENNHFTSPGNKYSAGGKNVNAIKLANVSALDAGVDGEAIVRYNFMNDIYTSENIGVCVDASSGGTYQIYYNVCIDSYTDGFHVDNNINTTIYNNTIRSDNDAIDIGGYATGVVVKNNIFDGGSDDDFSVRDTAAPTGDTNILVNDASVNEAGSGTYTGGGNDLFATDPLFTGNTDDDFGIPYNSPAANAGTDVGLSQDIAGVQIDGNPDIGAYEYSVQKNNLILYNVEIP